MEKIISLEKASKLCQELKALGKTIVLVGGCFDLLHWGHIKFLEKAKKEGEVLIVALESDENIRRLKGKKRPIHSQRMRAEMLAALRVVDLIICLPPMSKDKDYFCLVKKIRPDLIATSQDDPKFENKKKQARMVGAKIKVVSPYFKKFSTKKILNQENCLPSFKRQSLSKIQR